MSIQVEEALALLGRKFEEAEKKLVDLAFEKVQLDKKVEELTTELALAEMKIDEQVQRKRATDD